MILLILLIVALVLTIMHIVQTRNALLGFAVLLIIVGLALNNIGTLR